MYIEYKPSKKEPTVWPAYRYAPCPQEHFDNVVACKEVKAAIARGEMSGERIDGQPEPGSEGSYLIHHVIGKFGKPPPIPFTRLDAADAAEIFPYVPPTENPEAQP